MRETGESNTDDNFEIMWEPQEVSPYLLLIISAIPLFVPLIAAAAFIICVVIAVGIAGSGGAAGSQGGGGGAIVGLAIGAAIGVALVKFVYVAVPIAVYLMMVAVYIGINGFQEATGKRLVVRVGKFLFDLKIMALISLLSVGLFSLLIFYTTSEFLGIFEDEYTRSINGANLALSGYHERFTGDLSAISNNLNTNLTISIVAIAITSAWMMYVYVGFNFQISRSIYYCLGIIVTAFFFDALFTIIAYAAIDTSSYRVNSFINFSNKLDETIRYITIYPIRFSFSLFVDLTDLFDAMQMFFSTLSELMFTLIEVGLNIVLIEDGWLKNQVYTFIGFSKFLKVDFIFYVAASLVWYVRLRFAQLRRV